jgi:hypothetical protein
MLDWRQLALLADEALGALDVAELNLACAAGLPGAERIDHGHCLRTLDRWAECVRQYTEHYLPKFRADPARYQGSEAYYRCLALVTVLQRDLGVRYNPAKVAEDAPFDAADTFVHGVIQGDGGTCATMPVVYAAVGRRLGYPLRLAQARRHLLARWDDPRGERLNVEGTNRGLNCPPDEFYRTGAYAVGPEAERACGFLTSQAPRAELAGFLAQRGRRQYEWRDHAGAADSFAWACALAPESALHRACLHDVLEGWADRLDALRPGGPVPARGDVPAAAALPGSGAGAA